jgi:hypothetical protein
MAGTIVADTLTHSTAGSLTTDYVVNGSAKAWVFGTSAAALTDSFNASSGTDNGTGDYIYAFTSAMGNANFVGECTAFGNVSKTGVQRVNTTSDVRVNIITTSDGNASDNDNSTTVHGDLA